MSARFDCAKAAERAAGLEAAATALRAGGLAVLPTDTVYGVAADAFSPPAVARLLAVRGASRNAPPTVLTGTVRAAAALVDDAGPVWKDLVEEFWPGGLTLVCHANRSLAWDLGETKGAVAVRMPLHPVALDLLKQTGPLAVSSASKTGSAPPVTVAAARAQLGDAVDVYLDAGECPAADLSTIVDLTGFVPRLLRGGVIPTDRLREVIALAADEDEPLPAEDGGGLPPGGTAAGQGEDAGRGVEEVQGEDTGRGVEEVQGRDAGRSQDAL